MRGHATRWPTRVFRLVLVVATVCLAVLLAVPALGAGGRVWYERPILGESGDIVAIEVVDENVIFALEADGTCWSSWDGGTTWNAYSFGPSWISGDDIDMCDIDFIDAQHGWAVGKYDDCTFNPLDWWDHYAAIYYTSDYGQTWTRQDGGVAEDDQLNAVSAYSDQTVIAVGENGRAFKTIDAGTTWNENYGTLDPSKDFNDADVALWGWIAVGDNGTITQWSLDTEMVRTSGTGLDLFTVASVESTTPWVHYIALGEFGRYTETHDMGVGWSADWTADSTGWYGAHGFKYLGNDYVTSVGTNGDVTSFILTPGSPDAFVEFDSGNTSVVKDLADISWEETSGVGWAVGPAGTVLRRTASSVSRLWDMTRYTTAIEVSKGVFPDCSCDTVVLATGTSFPDALSASGLAGAYECPLLLVGSQLDEVITELNRLNASTVVIVGGTGAVSQDIEDVLDDTFTVDRIQGVDRYETSALVAERIEDLVGADVAFIVRGDNFADALAVSPFAYSQRMPVLLTASTALSGRTATALSDLDIEEAVIAGGEGAVVPGVKTTVDSILVANGGSESSRWWGADRYATARDVAEKGILAGWGTPGVVGLATGTNFPDALGGGAACGYHGGVLLLTTPSSLSSQAEGFLSANSGFVGEVRLFGGTGALADQVMTDAGVAIY